MEIAPNLRTWGDLEGLGGALGSGRNFAWQILVRPTQFCPGRAGCGRSPNLADPMPEAWILALVRPTQFCPGRAGCGHSQNLPDPMPQAWISARVRPFEFCAGRKSVENARVEQIVAGEGTFSTPTILPGSSRIWPRPDLARPWGLAKSGPGPMLAGDQVRDPKISDAKEQSFFQKVSQGSPKGICMVWS